MNSNLNYSKMFAEKPKRFLKKKTEQKEKKTRKKQCEFEDKLSFQIQMQSTKCIHQICQKMVLNK